MIIMQVREISVFIASASSEGSCELVHMRRHTRAIAARDVVESSVQKIDLKLPWIRQCGHLLDVFAQVR